MRRRQRQLSLKECYGILRLEKGADLETLKRAYRKRAFELHPDLNPDNPDASQLFQLLNEAYVALSVILKPAETTEQSTKPQSDATQKEKHKKPDAAADNKADQQQQTSEQTSQTDNEQKSAEKNPNAYAEQDVLRDLLNDPFARRVFEDIYSELNKQENTGPKTDRTTGQQTNDAASQPSSSDRQPPVGPQTKSSTRLHQGNLAWGTSKWTQDVKKGVTGVVKGWLRRQLDEELQLTLPAARLVPGRHIPLRIRQGISDEVQTVEITLPSDFTVGKPVRLRGLGRRVGPWQGDLYLTLYNE
ncbi:MAG: J domain-containing protein [Desulfovibrio sp.]|jgi:molecular chaperone DnaJ|nr:J domain-containing protein [Desulfovibrio sp.]